MSRHFLCFEVVSTTNAAKSNGSNKARTTWSATMSCVTTSNEHVQHLDVLGEGPEHVLRVLVQLHNLVTFLKPPSALTQHYEHKYENN